MSARRLLYLNTHRLTAYTWRQGSLHVDGAFDNNDDGLRAFADYLQRQHSSPLALLANIAEEGHVLETIPFLQGRDRQALISRKIGQHFMGSPLATAFSLGYEKTRRKNEKLLLSALTNPLHFAPWLERIGEAEAPLAGIYTVAQLGGPLLQKLGGDSQRCLLLTMQDHSIRESYLANGRTLFSRMAPLSDSSIAGIASAFAAEASKLQQYLIGQRLIGRDERLPVHIVAYPPAIPAIDKACPDHGNLSFTIIDSHVAAARLGLKTLPADNRCDLLYLQLLAIAPPRQQFADEAHRHDYRIDQLRQGILAAGLIALLGGLLFTAREHYTAYTLHQETRALLASESELEARYHDIAATFPQLGIDNEALRRLTNRHAELGRQQRQPEQALLRLSQTVDQMPAIALDSIEWRVGREAPGDPLAIDGHDEVTIVRGHIQLDATASVRQVLDSFGRFVDRLRLDPEQAVRVLQQPFDMESGRALRGGDGEGDGGQARPFAVEITRAAAR